MYHTIIRHRLQRVFQHLNEKNYQPIKSHLSREHLFDRRNDEIREESFLPSVLSLLVHRASSGQGSPR
jgi:hypothetical protein